MQLNTSTRNDGRAWKDHGPRKEAVHFNKYEEASILGVEMRIKKTPQENMGTLLRLGSNASTQPEENIKSLKRNEQFV